MHTDPAMPPHPELLTEADARGYLVAHCWPPQGRFCPRCGDTKLYALSGGRYRCAACRYTFQEFSGRWINNGNLPALVWTRLMRLFLAEHTVHDLSTELELSYNAAYKAVTAIRFAIMAHAPDAPQMFGPETGLRDYLKGAKLTGTPKEQGTQPIPVFGILERNGWVFIDLVSGMNPETVLHFNHSFHLDMRRAGNLIYTNRYRHYDALLFCGNDSLPYSYIRKNDGPLYLESQAFWKFAGPRLKRFKGITPQRFPLYLKELEFRFNHREDDLFARLTGYLCDSVPAQFHAPHCEGRHAVPYCPHTSPASQDER